MGASPVVLVDIVEEVGVTVVAGAVEVSVGPFSGEGLDEAFGFAVGLRAVGSGEEMFYTELEAGRFEGFRGVGGTVVGHDAGDFDFMLGVEGEGLDESGDDARDGLIFVDTSEAEAGVVVDRDVEGFGAGAFVAVGAVAGGAYAWLGEASEFLDIEVDEFTWGVAFVAHDRWRRSRQDKLQAVEAMAFEDAVDGGTSGASGLGQLPVAKSLVSTK